MEIIIRRNLKIMNATGTFTALFDANIFPFL